MSDRESSEERPQLEGSISLCLRQLKDGDSDAAQDLWDRYCHRLIGLARQKLGSSSRSSWDEQDVVQNAFTSFCIRARSGGFPNLRDRDGLWALLALMTARQAATQRIHERREKRGGKLTNKSSVDDSDFDWELVRLVNEEPSPEDGALFVAELERFMDSLDDPVDRLILLWKLEERTNPEIARHLDCSLSAVERKLRSIRRRLNQETE